MRIMLSPEADLTEVVADAAAAGADSIVLVVAPGRPPLAQTIAVAAIGPLAVEHAPATRINAVVVAGRADAAAVDAAVGFLEGARSTTGQVLTVS